MRYRIEDFKRKIAQLSQGLGQVNLMEVCGTHTANIYKLGIRQLLPENHTDIRPRLPCLRNGTNGYRRSAFYRRS